MRLAPSFATQSIIGIVSIAWAFAAVELAEERVAALAGDGAAVADALEVPVVAAVVGVQLPVVARGVVAAVAVERAVQVVQGGGGGMSDAVDIGIDRVAVDLRVDADAHGILGGGRHGAHPDDDERGRGSRKPAGAHVGNPVQARTTDAAGPAWFCSKFRACPGTNDTIDDGFVAVFPFAGAPGRWDDVRLIHREIQ